MKPYFQMNPSEKSRYREMVVRAVQNQWERAILYQDYEGPYEKWLHIYLTELERTDQFEQLQAFIDYHNYDNIRKRTL